MPSTPDQNATTKPAAPGLDGTNWKLTDLNGVTPVGEQPVTLEFFKPGRVGGMSSCNRYMGGFTVDAATISFTQMAGTMMACEQPLMDQEQAYLQLLSKGTGFAIAGDVLTITADDGASLTFSRA